MSNRPSRRAATEAEKKTKLEIANPVENPEEEDEEHDSSYENQEEEEIETTTSIATNKKKKSSVKRKRGEGPALCLSDDEEEQKAMEAIKKTVVPDATKEEAKPAPIDPKQKRVNDLWSTLNGSTTAKLKKVDNVLSRLNRKPKKKKKVRMDQTIARILKNKTKPDMDREKIKLAAKKALNNTGVLKVTQEMEFAGEKVQVTKVIDKASKDAVLQEEKQKASATQNKSALDKLINGMSKKTGINTVEKSNFDWQKYKAENLEQGELEKKSRDGYIEKQDFLQRVDLRKFEEEKKQRDIIRAKRAAESNGR